MEASERIFNFSFVDGHKKQELGIPVQIPLEEDVSEFVYRVMRNFMIPCYFYDGNIKFCSLAFILGWKVFFFCLLSKTP